MEYLPRFKDSLTREFSKKMEVMIFDTHQRLSAIIPPYKYTQHHSSESCLFSLEKTCDIEC